MKKITINATTTVQAYGRSVRFVNLTPHEVSLVLGEAYTLVIEPSGSVARVSCTTKVHDYVRINIEGEELYIPLAHNEYGEVEGLPDFQVGTYLIVSSLVKSRVPDRHDTIVPNDSVRDSNGRIIGCKSFCEVF